MIIALDYDGTYTEDPAFWNKFIDLAENHRVICVTERWGNEKDAGILALQKRVGCVYFTQGQAKQEYMDEVGIRVDVWIDDAPYFITNDWRKNEVSTNG